MQIDQVWHGGYEGRAGLWVKCTELSRGDERDLRQTFPSEAIVIDSLHKQWWIEREVFGIARSWCSALVVFIDQPTLL